MSECSPRRATAPPTSLPDRPGIPPTAPVLSVVRGLFVRDRDRECSRRPPRAGGGGAGCRRRVGGRRRAGRAASRGRSGGAAAGPAGRRDGGDAAAPRRLHRARLPLDGRGARRPRGCDRFEAHRRVAAAEQVCPRVGLDGAVLPPRLLATAAVFADGGSGCGTSRSSRRSSAARRPGGSPPRVWTGAEEILAEHAGRHTPAELHRFAVQLVTALDQDGPEPRDDPPPVNELFLTPSRDGGGTITGRFGDAALWGAITTLIEAKTAPRSNEDPPVDGAATRRRPGRGMWLRAGPRRSPADRWAPPDADGHRRPRRPGAACSRSGARPGRSVDAGRAAPALLRRRSGTGSAGRVRAAAGRRPGDPHHSGRPAPGGRRPGSWMRLPRMRPAAVVGRGAPRGRVAARWADRDQQSGDVVRPAPSGAARVGLGCPNPRRVAGVRAASLDRPRSTHPPQTSSGRRPTARYPTTRHQTGPQLRCGSRPRRAGSTARGRDNGLGMGRRRRARIAAGRCRATVSSRSFSPPR